MEEETLNITPGEEEEAPQTDSDTTAKTDDTIVEANNEEKNTENLSPEEKPVMEEAPSGEDLPQEELNKIIENTINILEMCQKKVDEQKIDSHSLTFMLLRIKESLDAYSKEFIPKLNAFLFHAEKITADYYQHIVNEHLNYCADRKAIENQTSETINCGSGTMIRKDDFLTLMKLVTDNYYASGKSMKAGRQVMKDIYNSIRERLDIVNKIGRPMPAWMEVQDSVNGQLEGIRQQTFKISAYVDFLKQGETKMSPALDLTQLKKPHDKTTSSDNMCTGKQHGAPNPN